MLEQCHTYEQDKLWHSRGPSKTMWPLYIDVQVSIDTSVMGTEGVGTDNGTQFLGPSWDQFHTAAEQTFYAK